MDTWDSNLTSPIGSFLSGFYYYFVKSDELNLTSGVLGNCNAIHSCWWSPILEFQDFQTTQVNYDVARFGKINGNNLSSTPILNRITGISNFEKTIGKCKIYETSERVKWRSPKNESRLLNFPYSYALITDFMNIPIELRYNELPLLDNTFEIKAKAMLSDRGTYSIYVNNVKGDYFGRLESNINSAPLDVPVSSSAYSTWSSTQKAQDLQNTRNAIMNANTSMLSSGVGAVGSALNLDLGSTLQNGINIYASYQQKQQAIGMRSAQQKDLRNTPRTMINTGSDVFFSMLNGNKKISLYRYSLYPEFEERLTDFFTMYGYKQSKIMTPNLRSRYYFNYIKTLGANIKPKTGIPKEHLAELANIFDNGVTIWHIDRKNVTMMDYSLDNYEMELKD